MKKMTTPSGFEGNPFELVIWGIQKLPNERMQKVLVERFGLDDRRPKTLEEIGRKLAITRERVRQIENEALKKLEKNKSAIEIDKVLDKLYFLLDKYQGIASELRLMNEYRKDKLSEADRRALILILRLSKDIQFLNKPQEYERAWFHQTADVDTVHELKHWLIQGLKNENKTLSDQEILELINRNQKLKAIPDHVLHSYIDIPRDVQKNIFGKWGLVSWPEVKPKTVRDKIYMVFKKSGKPMHFREIAKEVNTLGVDRKSSCTPTVHNELIKDSRFVLIGRGIYALKEWKYQPGTVADILTDIIKQHKHPLSKKELIEEVLKQRRVQPNTIILNLQNSKKFKKDREGNYSLATLST